MEEKEYLHYEWKVTSAGEVSPANERAEKLHKMAAKALLQGQSVE